MFYSKGESSFNFVLTELICAIGLGVAGLLSVHSDKNLTWGLKAYSLTGVSKCFCLYLFLWDLMMLWQWVSRYWPSGMWCHVFW